MSEFDPQKIDKMIRQMPHDDIDDIRDIARVGDSFLLWMQEQELRIDLWMPMLLAVCRKIFDDWSNLMENPITFEEYLARYAIEAAQHLKGLKS